MKSEHENDRARFDTAQIDTILEQVRERREKEGAGGAQPQYPKTPKGEEWAVNTILHELGIEPARKKKTEPILINVPGVPDAPEEKAGAAAGAEKKTAKGKTARGAKAAKTGAAEKVAKAGASEKAGAAQDKPAKKAAAKADKTAAGKPARSGADKAGAKGGKKRTAAPADRQDDALAEAQGVYSEPFVQDLHKEESEPPTLELPTIKAYADAEAQKQEEERRRIMEQAQREAQNTIHNAAQFAMQMEISRQMAAIDDEDAEDEPIRGNNLFGEVDDQFREFFSRTVVADRAAMDEAVNGHKKRGFLQRLLHRRAMEETAPLTGEFDALMPGTPGYLRAHEDEILRAGKGEREEKAPRAPKEEARPARGARRISVQTDTVGEVTAEHTVEDTGGLRADVFTLNMASLAQPGPVETGRRRLSERSLQDIDIPLSDEEKARRSRARRLAGAQNADVGADEYSALSDAPVVAANLATMRKTRLLRVAVTGVLALVMLFLGMAARAGLPLPGLLDANTTPLFYLLVNFVLLAVCSLVSLTTLSAGFLGLAQEPTTDSFTALAVAGALVQNVGYLFASGSFEVQNTTLFAPVAAVLLFGNAVGKWMQIRTICRNFALTSSGAEHAAAFLMGKQQLAKRLCAGLGEEDPVLLVSRPTALVKGFLSQSFSARLYDAMAQTLSYAAAGAALVCAAVCGIVQKDALAALSGFAGALCLMVPLASTLVYAVPGDIMQKYAARYHAVIPGPSAIQALGSANTVLLSAADLFPKGSVRLHGIKTFERERIDLAILYAASILAKNCDTLKDIFLNIIQNNTKLLYPVESVVCEAGYGFTGWIEHNRVIIGNREMMLRHDIEVPSADYEKKVTKGGRYAVIYLSVSGRLFGMFLVSYQPDRGAARILNSLTRSGISVLVQSEDFNVTSSLVANTYRIPQGVVKVLSQPECDALNAETAYRATSEGVMIHDGSCQSFLGGMRAASCAAAGEHLARNVQAGALIFGAVVALALSFYAGLSGLGLGTLVLYQLIWAGLTVLMPVLRRP